MMSENESGSEFVGEQESLEGNDEIDRQTNSEDDRYREFVGEVSLEHSHELHEDTMSGDSGSRQLVRDEGTWGGEQESSGKSSTGSRKEPGYPSDISGEKDMSEHTSSTTLRQSWTNDMQLVSMYLDEKHERIMQKKSFLAARPELEDLLSDYVATILFVQPEDVIGFTAQHFKAFAVQPN